MICKRSAVFVMVLKFGSLLKMVCVFVRNFGDFVWISCTKTEKIWRAKISVNL